MSFSQNLDNNSKAFGPLLLGADLLYLATACGNISIEVNCDNKDVKKINCKLLRFY